MAMSPIPTQTNGGSEQSWAGHPEKMIDFAYRAMHVSTVAAKAIVRDYYGQAPAKPISWAARRAAITR